jgi:hypothetical protein
VCGVYIVLKYCRYIILHSICLVFRQRYSLASRNDKSGRPRIAYHCNKTSTLFSGLALGYGLDDREFESRQGLGIFLFTTVSIPVLGPTQPPIQ